MATQKTYLSSSFISLTDQTFHSGILLDELVENSIDAIAVELSGSSAVVRLNSDLSDWSGSDVVISTHTGEKQLTLGELKTQRYIDIDSKTSILINAGFTFDSSSFSLSLAAQSNWTNIHSGKDELSASGAFPMDVTTLNNDEYSLDYGDVNSFWMSAVGTVKYYYDSGRSLKKSIFDASGSAQVNVIIDNR
ncbi:MAG: hypothetical protein ACXAD7_29055 [Candidatus Kariarchaeaceae archaeon]|jgi:hypothetical protein